ncbi:excisionase family DNA binding protein [Desulfitispora alkaliphila]|uniref:MerR family transcriptional regulator n=1 Tax=Desulfitispora alkaliphila TaxID=622674 RepID=UPI003D1EE813
MIDLYERVQSDEERVWDSVIVMLREDKKDYAQAIFKSIIEKTFLLFKQPVEFIYETNFKMPSEDCIYKIKHLDIEIKKNLREKRIDSAGKLLVEYLENLSKTSDIDYKEITSDIITNLYSQSFNCTCYRVEEGANAATTSEAAEILGVSTQTMRRWLEQGKFLEAFQTEGGHWRIPKKYFKTSLEQTRKAEQLMKDIDKKHSTGELDEFDLI